MKKRAVVTEFLNSNSFYINTNFLLALWKDLIELNQKQLKLLKKIYFGEVMTERKKLILRIQYMATWHDETFDVNMTSSEVVRKRHHIRTFLHISLVLKIKPNTGQTLGTMDKIERRKNMAKSEGPNSECNIEIFSKSKKSSQWRTNMAHFLPKSDKE